MFRNMLILVCIAVTLVSTSVFAGKITKDMSWDELRDSGKISILNEKISFGDALGHKMSIFGVCKTADGNFQSINPKKICDEVTVHGRSGLICASSDYRIVKFDNRFVDYTCSAPRCDRRRRVITKLSNPVMLTVYSKGEGRQGPFHELLFRKAYTIPNCY